MESTKNVIEIVKLPDNKYGYEEHYYFQKASIINGKTHIDITGDIWDAVYFNEYNEEIKTWRDFVKAFFENDYTVCITQIRLNYPL